MTDRLSEDQLCIVSATGSGKPWRGTVKSVKPKGYGVEPDGSRGEIVHVPERKAKPESSSKKTAPLIPPVGISIGEIKNSSVIMATMDMRPLPKPQEPARSIPYMRWVKRHDCMHCGAFMPSDPDHYGDHGMAQKCSDFLTVALCRKCHDARTATNCLPGRTRAETHQIMLGAQAVLMQEALELLPLDVRVDVLARALEGVDSAVLNAALK
jgi:hypothetical protein